MSLQRPSRTHSCLYSFRLRVYAIRLWPTWRTASSNAHYFWISHFDISRSAPRISLRWFVPAFLNITGMRSNPNRKCALGLDTSAASPKSEQHMFLRKRAGRQATRTQKLGGRPLLFTADLVNRSFGAVNHSDISRSRSSG